MALLLSLPSTLAPAIAQSGSPPAVFADQGVPPFCSWRNVTGATQGTAGFAEGNSTMWITYYYAYPGQLLHIKGQYPYARFMAFTVQPVSRDDSGAVRFVTTGSAHLYDMDIRPDKGSINPFAPGADRNASKRFYNVWIRFKPLTGKPRGNTLFGGASGLGALSFRVYGPDKGRDAKGGMPLPTIDKWIFHSDGSKPDIIHLPLCSSVSRLSASAISQQLSKAFAKAPPDTWKPLPSSGQDSLQDYSLLAARLPSRSSLTVLRFVAPSFPNTWYGRRITGHEQVRYWSVCAYGLTSGRSNGCVADYQAHLDTRGYVTIVVGDDSLRPKAPPALRSANWLSFGREQQSVLIYRQLIPARGFTQALPGPTGSDSGLRPRMGPYYPTLTTCTSGDWSAGRCRPS